MSKTKQAKTEGATTAVSANGKAASYTRTRIATRDGIGTAQNMLNVLNSICIDHSEAAEIDPNLLLKGITKVQGLVGLGIRAAAEARRNPNFKSSFFLTS